MALPVTENTVTGNTGRVTPEEETTPKKPVKPGSARSPGMSLSQHLSQLGVTHWVVTRDQETGSSACEELGRAGSSL